MFTGLIEGVGEVVKREGERFWIAHPWGEPLPIGASVALDGMCTTVVETDARTFGVDVIAESRAKTTFGHIEVGSQINLERAAVIGQRNNGHPVLGHVDTTVEVHSITSEEGSYRVRMELPEKYAHWMVEKGSVTVNGVGLTVAALEADWFEVALIPHTWEETTLHRLKSGMKVNVEFDVIAKYLRRYKELGVELPTEATHG